MINVAALCAGIIARRGKKRREEESKRLLEEQEHTKSVEGTPKKQQYLNPSYGYSLQNYSDARCIVSIRIPKESDISYQVGQFWFDKSSKTLWILAGFLNNKAEWINLSL
jgi:hypothetical protein